MPAVEIYRESQESLSSALIILPFQGFFPIPIQLMQMLDFFGYFIFLPF